MKRVMTALNHPVINQYLKNNYPDFVVEYEDIKQQEGVLKALRGNIPDVLILNENLPGPFDKRNFIEKIRRIDKYFKIVIIVSKEDDEFNNFLFAKGIFDVLINDKAEIIDLIYAVNRDGKVIIKKEIPKEVNEELQTLKKLLEQKQKVIEKQIIIEPPPRFQRQEIITVSGAGAVGKSDLVTQLSALLAKRSAAKILVIDLNTEFPSLDQFFGIIKQPQGVDYFIGSEKNSCLNYMVDNIDKGRFDSAVFDELVIRHKRFSNLHILTGNYSLYACQNTLSESYYKAILEKAKELYDFIFIDTSSNIFLDSTYFAVTNATKVFFVVEGTCVNLRKSLRMLDLYTSTWDVKKEKIKVIVNKYDKYSIDKEIIKEMVQEYSISGYIRHDARHTCCLNKNIPMVLRVSKNDIEPYLGILEEMNFVRKRTIFERLFQNKGDRLIRGNKTAEINDKGERINVD